MEQTNTRLFPLVESENVSIVCFGESLDCSIRLNHYRYLNRTLMSRPVNGDDVDDGNLDIRKRSNVCYHHHHHRRRRHRCRLGRCVEETFRTNNVSTCHSRIRSIRIQPFASFTSVCYTLIASMLSFQLTATLATSIDVVEPSNEINLTMLENRAFSEQMPECNDEFIGIVNFTEFNFPGNIKNNNKCVYSNV